jgi:uncharacterized protein YggE
VQGSPEFGLTVLVDVAPLELPSVGDQIVLLVEEASEITSIDSGVVFGLDECSDLVAELRRRAIDEARDEAGLLATAAEVELGGIVGVSDASPTGYLAFATDGAAASEACPDARDGLLGGFDLGGSFGSSITGHEPFDAPAEAVVSTSLTVTFAVGGAVSTEGTPAAAVSAVGRSVVRGDADDAYVVAYVDPSAVESVGDVEDDLVRDLEEYGVLDGDVRVEIGYDAVIQVRLDPSDVAENGPRVVDAIESRAGEPWDSGVWYTADACPDILAEARDKAFVNAHDDARAIADTAGVRIGGPILVSDASFINLSVPPDRCGLLPADSADEGYPIDLAEFGDESRVELEVWLEVSFAISE